MIDGTGYMKRLLLIFGLIYTVLITSVCNSVNEKKDSSAGTDTTATGNVQEDNSRVIAPDTSGNVPLQQTDSIPH